MSHEALKQSLSALIDNETDELELRRVLNACDEAELRACWSRYQIAHAAMHNEPFHAQVDLSAKIMAAIDAEPVLTAAKPERSEQAAISKRMRSTPWLSRVAVAASVTLAVLGGVRFYNQDTIQQDAIMASSEQRLPAANHAQGPVVLASYSAQSDRAAATQSRTESDAWYERRLPSYLLQHAQQSSVNKTESGLPYARAASLEGQ
ncbi:RNA polymerase subunit sigma [Pseudomonas sp. C27(2019)]|uniref:sigma-E factor negative regulatory protein n=1 Tax=Pseudomonas sp. C27(2019) TaxID=2604941 RepID=UPI0012473E35|nr:RseA family anti-sigma factor [Pseudomonas sp. C27(2019)]QEY58990.1 RNA polymerase subunit sigma [Pseudomonas sp. C27(2019)]